MSKNYDDNVEKKLVVVVYGELFFFLRLVAFVDLLQNLCRASSTEGERIVLVACGFFFFFRILMLFFRNLSSIFGFVLSPLLPCEYSNRFSKSLKARCFAEDNHEVPEKDFVASYSVVHVLRIVSRM